MRKKDFLIVTGSVFGTVGILHLLRAVRSWDLLIESFALPVWFSYLARVFLLIMSYYAFKLSKK